MRIGILETGFPPKHMQEAHGLYSTMFERLLGGHGFDFAVWRPALGEVPGSPEEADGWLITGSKYAVYDDRPWIPRLEALVREAMARKIPVVGICFGHQLMAQATGAKVVKSEKGWGLGPHDYEDLTTGRRLTAMAVHQDQVITQPEGTRLTARSEFCPVAGLEWEDAPAVSWQPHPEFEPGFVRALIEDRRGEVYSEDLAQAALRRLEEPLDSQELGRRIAAFFREHARQPAA
ncbi:MAG: type 1 glutamine amidotransferase [Pseudomonadota bacterium]